MKYGFKNWSWIFNRVFVGKTVEVFIFCLNVSVFILFALSCTITYMIYNVLKSCLLLQERRAEMVRQNKERISNENDEQQTASSG
jgi:hypothetical protein